MDNNIEIIWKLAALSLHFATGIGWDLRTQLIIPSENHKPLYPPPPDRSSMIIGIIATFCWTLPSLSSCHHDYENVTGTGIGTGTGTAIGTVSDIGTGICICVGLPGGGGRDTIAVLPIWATQMTKSHAVWYCSRSILTSWWFFQQMNV